jgi:histidinol-phosphate aminotransferase
MLLLDLMTRTLRVPGLNAITSEPSFIVYPIATKAAGGTLITVPMKNDAFDLDAVAAAIDRNTRIVFLANPNNPTGTMLTATEIDHFLSRVPQHVVVVLDEAYYDFAQHFAKLRGVNYSRSLDSVRAGQCVIVLRTFSKAHGLAGVRVGYGIGSAELMARFAHMRTIYSISAVAQAAALAALEDEAHIRMTVESNAQQAHRLTERISRLGYRVTPTWANFLYCELGEDAAAVAKRLQAEGVAIQPLGPWGAPQAIRITIGTPEQNEVFLAAFKKVMERAPTR